MTKEWHSRGYIPHWERGDVVQSITFRLADSLPSEVLGRWADELATLAKEKATVRRRARIEAALDRGHGEALLRGGVAELVEDAFLHFDADRYRLHAWVIMPNHVHVLITPARSETLSAIVHSWKSFTAKKANAVLMRSGVFWSREYFDRAIRDEAHYANALAYMAMNPVKAGLCNAVEDWRFSSAWRGRKGRRDAGAPRQGAPRQG
jgi:putative DNA methylase